MSGDPANESLWRASGSVRLPRATAWFFGWLNTILAEFRRIDGAATRGAVACVVLNRVFSLLAFFLPLKVILLLASDGVPSYFRGFVSEATRDSWIVALAASSVLFYGLALLCEVAEARYAAQGSTRVLRESNKLSLMRNQDDVARGYFSRFCTVQSHTLFALLLGMVILILFPALLVFLTVLLMTEWVVAALALGDLKAEPTNWLGRHLHSGIRDALAVVASVNFLLVFGFLVVVFLYMGGVNTLIAILSILLVRQLFGSLQLLIANGVRLSRQADRANALIFRSAQMTAKVPNERVRFYRNFSKSSRDRLFCELLDVAPGQLHSHYLDRVRPGVNVFDIQCGNGLAERAGRVLVHHPSVAHLVAHEALLLEHVDRRAIRRDAAVCLREIDGFVCRSFDWGGDVPVKVADWDSARRELLVDLWAVQPSDELREIYQTSKPLLHERLTPELLSRLEVAIDTADERRGYQALLDALPSVREVVGALPLFIDNGGLIEPFTLFFERRAALVLNWDRWQLSPVGVGLDMAKRDPAWFEANHDEILSRRPGLASVAPDQLLLAAMAANLESMISSGLYKRALGLISQLLSRLESAPASDLESRVAK